MLQSSVNSFHLYHLYLHIYRTNTKQVSMQIHKKHFQTLIPTRDLISTLSDFNVQCNVHFFISLFLNNSAARSNGFQETCNAVNLRNASQRVSRNTHSKYIQNAL